MEKLFEYFNNKDDQNEQEGRGTHGGRFGVDGGGLVEGGDDEGKEE